MALLQTLTRIPPPLLRFHTFISLLRFPVLPHPPPSHRLLNIVEYLQARVSPFLDPLADTQSLAISLFQSTVDNPPLEPVSVLSPLLTTMADQSPASPSGPRANTSRPSAPSFAQSQPFASSRPPSQGTAAFPLADDPLPKHVRFTAR